MQLTVAGPDAVGASSALFIALATAGCELLDCEQVTIQGQLVLTCLVEGVDSQLILSGVNKALRTFDLRVSASEQAFTTLRPAGRRLHVTLLAKDLGARHLAVVSTALAELGANIDRIGQLARSPLSVYELLISGGDHRLVRPRLSSLAVELGIDIAVQDDEIHRRAKRLVVLDVDSTLVKGEVIDALAERAGVATEVSWITERAMRGELDFTASLRARVALLAGLPTAALEEVAAGIELTPGARRMVRTLKQLGYAVGVVSGGFTFATEHLRAELDLDFAEANILEQHEGALTGRVLPPILDRAAKAAALQRFCVKLGIDARQAVAVGDGANDLDMLAAAGLGIAFNAKPLVRREAAVSLSSPNIDAVLFLLGLSAAEIAALS